MAKTPRTRHSTPKREPVTIDLEAVKVEETPKAPSGAQPSRERPASVQAPDSVQPDVSAHATEPNQIPEDASAAPNSSVEAETGPASDRTESGAEASGLADVSPAEDGGGNGGDGGAETSDDKARGASPQPAPATAARSAGSAIAGGMIGGIVALLAAGGLQYAGVLPALNAQQGAAAALRDEIAALQGQIADLRTNQPALPSFDAERRQISELRDMVQSLEQRLQTEGSGGQSRALSEFEQRLGNLERSVAELPQRLVEAGSATEFSDRLQAAEQEIANLRQTVNGVADAARQAAEEAAGQKVSGLATWYDELSESLNSLQVRVDELAAEVARQDDGPKVAVVVAASSLKSAIERGAPFASELETYSALASNASELEPLRPYADSGIPALATLGEEASKLASRIAAAERAVPESAGLLDRFTASIRSIVTVRPVGEVPGEQPSAIAARMEAAVQRGDLAAALREYESLPDDMKALGVDFAAKLRARQAADDILDKALSTALKPA